MGYFKPFYLKHKETNSENVQILPAIMQDFNTGSLAP
jgi:hypothetical protein